MTGYRRQLQTVVAGSATPYGYTLTLWTSTTVVSASRGAPRAVDALALLIGATCCFVAVGMIAAGGPRRHAGPAGASTPPVLAALHLPAAGAAMLLGRLLAAWLHGCLLWAAVGAVSTGVYVTGTAIQYWYAGRAARP